MKSFLGYKDNSPYRYNPFNIINTPKGLITMDGVSTPLIAFSELGERKYLPPNSGLHKFKGKKILEIPVMQGGGVFGDIASSLAINFGLNKASPVAETVYDVYNIWKALKEGDAPKASLNMFGALIPGVSGKVLESTTEPFLPATPDIEKRKMKFALNTRGSEIIGVLKKYGNEYWKNPQFLKDYKDKFQEGGSPERENKSSGDYNLKRARELGFTPDENGHLPSVDPETGIFLKMPWHKTIHLEEEWFNSDDPQAVEYRKTHTLNKKPLPWQYEPITRQFQKGGTNPPIYVTDPRDPRLRAYNDSLNLYKAYQFQKNNSAVPYQQWLNDVGKNYPGGPEALKKAREKNIGAPGTKISNEKSSEFKPTIPDSQYDPPYSGDNKIINYYKSLIGSDKNYRIGVHNSPDLWHKDIKSIGMYYDGAESPIYKQPVQPYILLDKKPWAEYKSPTAQLLNRERTETPNIISTPQERLNIPLVKPYTVDYFDPELKQRTSRLFASDKEGAQFMKELDPATGLPQYKNRGDYEVSGYYSKYRKGGVTPCFKCGGLKKYQQAGTKRTRTEDLRKEWPTISSLATDQPQQLILNGPNPNQYLWTNFSLDGEQPVPKHPDYEAWKRDNALKQNTPPISTDDKFPLRPIDAIIGANLGLRGWSSNMEHNRQKEAIFNNYQDNNFNPTFSRAFNDYGQNGLGLVKKGGFYFRPKNKFQDGGEFDPYEFLFGDDDVEQERLVKSEIEEKSSELAERELELQRQQEELEEAQNYALAMEQPDYGSFGTGSQGTYTPKADILELTDIASKTYGVPKDLLLSQQFAESSGNPNAVSSKGAFGLTQFMPKTAEAYGVKKGDVASQINGQAAYMRDLYDQFGSWDLAIMAYNAGPGNVRSGKAFKFKETKDYLQKIKNTKVTYEQGGEYDLSTSEINDLIARGYKIKTL